MPPPGPPLHAQVWAIAEGRGAAAAATEFLATQPAKYPEGAREWEG